jgi:hypothetical protein
MAVFSAVTCIAALVSYIMRNAQTFSDEKPEGKRPHGRSRYRWKAGIKTD